MKTRQEVRMQFFNETFWNNGQEEPDVDYVHWLEDKLIQKSNTPVIIEQKKKLCLCSWPTSRINRVEVIDEKGRSYVNRKPNNRTELHLQDNGRTLKVFIWQ